MAGHADAVIIGAGPNGLVAANLLADAGWTVVVVEATDAPGGAVRSAEVTAPGYLSDLGSAFYPLAAASPVFTKLNLHRYGLRWRHAPDVLGHLFADGRAVVLSRDPKRTAQSVEEFAPGDGARWLAAYRHWQRLAPGLLRALFTPFPPVRAGASLVRQLHVGGALRLARQFVLPARVFGSELFCGSGGQLLLAGSALHTDLSIDEAGSGVYGWLLTMAGQQYGFPVPAGGAGRITDALVARLRTRGGRIVCGAPVGRVPVRHGRAIGVDTMDGRRFLACRAVLADVAAPALYLDLVGAEHLPEQLVADLDRFQWDGGTVKVDWALAGRMPWQNAAVRGAGTVHLGADLDGLARYSAALNNGVVPAEPFLVIGQLSTADPARSPAGTESLWGYTRLPRRPQWTHEEIAGHVARMEAVLERYAPGFANLVVARHVTGPGDLQAADANLVGGAIGGGVAAPYQQLCWRPVPGLGRADTPIDRLFLASSSAHPGGGVHGGPGANAARAALARDRAVSGPLYAATVRAMMRSLYR